MIGSDVMLSSMSWSSMVVDGCWSGGIVPDAVCRRFCAWITSVRSSLLSCGDGECGGDVGFCA